MPASEQEEFESRAQAETKALNRATSLIARAFEERLEEFTKEFTTKDNERLLTKLIGAIDARLGEIIKALAAPKENPNKELIEQLTSALETLKIPEPVVTVNHADTGVTEVIQALSTIVTEIARVSQESNRAITATLERIEALEQNRPASVYSFDIHRDRFGNLRKIDATPRE